MVKSFDVVYDDFSGGHFVGQTGTKQPKNTFVGANVATCETDGTLLPVKAFFDATGALGGNTAANCSRMLLDPLTGRYVWAGNTTAYAITNVGATPPWSVSSVATGAAAQIDSIPCAFHAKVLFPSSATTNIISLNASAMTVSLIAVGFGQQMLCAYGEFVMAVSNLTNRIYFSNPGAETVWTTATDFFDVGAPGTGISGMCVHQGSLFIATSVGMWVANGIPGSTLSLRQITTVPFGEPTSIDTSVVETFGVYGAAVSELAGTRLRALNYGLCPDGRPSLSAGAGMGRVFNAIAFAYSDIGSVVDEGGQTVDLGATVWVFDFYNGRWHRRQVTVAPVRMGIAANRADVYYRAGSPDAETVWVAPSFAVDLVCNNDGTPAVGTAELAEYFHPVPFTVKEVLVEVDYGAVQTSFAGLSATAATVYAAADRAVAVKIETPGVPIEAGQDLSESRSQSSVMSQTLPARAQTGANYTTRRSFVRFNPTDGSDTYTATPVVTLTGVKLRRLILRCVEVG